MRIRLAVPPLAVLLVLGAVACQDPVAPPQAAAPQAAKKTAGGGGGAPLLADVVTDTAAYASFELNSTCPGETSKAYAVLFKHTSCLIVTPTGSSYALTDDLVIGTVVRRGYIEAVRFSGQDVIGAEGIYHETDWLPIVPAVKASKEGFTLPVNVDGVVVWRTDSHTESGANRVEAIGTISIGTIVYHQ